MLIATRSPDKLAEIRDVLGGCRVFFLSLTDIGLLRSREEDFLERFESFRENALSKATHFHQASGLATIADDSGLCVDALRGGPGVRTRRFAPESMVARWGRDEANNRYLLEKLAGVGEQDRGAHYHCSLAAVGPRGSTIVEGRVDGRIALEPRGQEGFGYDPLFVLPSYGRTYAELGARIKRETSHRSVALRKLIPWLEGLA
ncbi:MAG: non-canonical purine NTP pyrophosphatase [Gemmatimonadota bacterium]